MSRGFFRSKDEDSHEAEKVVERPRVDMPISPPLPAAQPKPRVTSEQVKRPEPKGGAMKESLTVVGVGTTIKGEIASPDQAVEVNGTVEGQISAEKLTISPEGKVIGDIHATDVTVSGTVIGNINAKNRVVLEKSARFEGVGDPKKGKGPERSRTQHTITTKTLNVAEGAHFEGSVNMGSPISDEAPSEKEPVSSLAKTPEPAKEERSDEGPKKDPDHKPPSD